MGRADGKLIDRSGERLLLFGIVGDTRVRQPQHHLTQLHQNSVDGAINLRKLCHDATPVTRITGGRLRRSGLWPSGLTAGKRPVMKRAAAQEAGFWPNAFGSGRLVVLCDPRCFAARKKCPRILRAVTLPADRASRDVRCALTPSRRKPG